MGMGVVGMGIYCGDRFTVYAYIKSLCCTPETNIMLHVCMLSHSVLSSSLQPHGL